MPGKPNWFIALPLDGGFLSLLPAPPPGVRCFGRDDVHLTVCFFGGCDEASARAAWALLDTLLVASLRVPIPYSLGPVVPMGSPRRYSALSALLCDGREEASGLIAALRDPLLAAAGTEPDARPPKPHITVARPARKATSEERAAALAWSHALDLSHVRGTLDRIALYTWSAERRTRLFQIAAERALT